MLWVGRGISSAAFQGARTSRGWTLPGDSDPEKWDYPPHTQAKHAILSSYLDAWYPILASTNGRILYLDGFAGRGRYASGEPGSPLIALERLLGHAAWPRMQHREFIFLFIEYDAANVASLRTELAAYRDDYERRVGPWPKSVQWEVRQGAFADHATELTGYLRQQKTRLAPTFAMVDPFGWTGMPMEVLADLLDHPSCEVLVNFMVGFINRFLEHPDQAGNMGELFALDVDSIMRSYVGGDRVAYLRDVYIAQLKSRAKFPHVRWFAVHNSTGNVAYFLLHGTRNHVGVERMKDAMWKTAPTGSFSFTDHLAGHDVLFEPEPDLSPLRDALLRQYRGRGATLINPDIQQWVVLETPFRKPHLTQVLRELERETPSTVLITRPSRIRQYARGVSLTVL